METNKKIVVKKVSISFQAVGTSLTHTEVGFKAHEKANALFAKGGTLDVEEHKPTIEAIRELITKHSSYDCYSADKFYEVESLSKAASVELSLKTISGEFIATTKKDFFEIKTFMVKNLHKLDGVAITIYGGEYPTSDIYLLCFNGILYAWRGKRQNGFTIECKNYVDVQPRVDTYVSCRGAYLDTKEQSEPNLEPVPNELPLPDCLTLYELVSIYTVARKETRRVVNPKSTDEAVAYLDKLFMKEIAKVNKNS